MRIFDRLRRIRQSWSKYDPAIRVLISGSSLLHNLKTYRNHFPGLMLAPVIKSNAYGHGLLTVARILDKEDIPFLVVDSLYEALVLRNGGIRSGILVIGFTSAENIVNCAIADVAFTISSLDQLRQIAGLIRSGRVLHLKIDTGMRRQGILPEEVGAALELIKSRKQLILEGICSHLADADGSDSDFTRQQISVWQAVRKSIRDEFGPVKYEHLSATAGLDYAGDDLGNAARLGIGLYGINPSPRLSIDLQPVLRMEAVISLIRTMSVGEAVGYGLTYKAEQEIKAAVVPVGYFEGVDRRLSNRGKFTVNGQVCPIIGRVSMNITVIDASAVPDVKMGDKAIIISDDPQAPNSVSKLAEMAGTIPYEILVHVPAHLRRIVI